MNPERAIRELEALKIEAADPDTFWHDFGQLQSWQHRLRAVLIRSLGRDHDLVSRLEALEYVVDEDDQKRHFDAAVRYACGCIEGAIYELQLDVAETTDASNDKRTATDSVEVDRERARKVFVVHGRNTTAR